MLINEVCHVFNVTNYFLLGRYQSMYQLMCHSMTLIKMWTNLPFKQKKSSSLLLAGEVWRSDPITFTFVRFTVLHCAALFSVKRIWKNHLLVQKSQGILLFTVLCILLKVMKIPRSLLKCSAPMDINIINSFLVLHLQCPALVQKTMYRHWMTVYGRVRFQSKTRETLKRLKFQRQPERLKSCKVVDSQCWGLSFFYSLTWQVTLCRVYLFPFKMCQVSKL